MVRAVRLAFKESGGEFNHPTIASLDATIAVLSRKAEAWGTPADIIQHHRGQMAALLRRIRRGP